MMLRKIESRDDLQRNTNGLKMQNAAGEGLRYKEIDKEGETVYVIERIQNFYICTTPVFFHEPIQRRLM